MKAAWTLSMVLKPTCRSFVLYASALILAIPCQVANAAITDTEPTTYKLTQSTSSLDLWTTPPSERVFKDTAIPAATGAEVKVYAARNEVEPFQVVVKPASSGNVVVSIDAFGSGIATEIFQVKYVNITQATDSLGRTGPYPDPLWPLAGGATVPLTANENTSFWFSVSVPSGTPSGDYTASVHIGAITIPVRLHVFNFEIPDELHVASQMNVSHDAILSKYSVTGTDAAYWTYVDTIKQYFIDHRLTPAGVLWPGGLTGGGTFAEPFIDYNCTTHALSDSWGIWGFQDPAQRYLAGSGLLGGRFTVPFNGGVGFSTFMAASFADNDPSSDQRPSPFCGLTRSSSDWLQNPTSAYNTAWFAYVTAMQNYLSSQGYLGKAYHYIANEPQDQADYDAVAWYSRYAHSAAPDLKLMVSEEPRAEIYDQPGAHIDIWLPLLQNYDPAVSHDREANHGEATWVYFLRSTPPYFNPITLDHPGIESKLTGWFLWKYRVRGIYYYSLNDWTTNPWTNPMPYGYDHNGETFMLYPPSENNTAIAYGSNGHRFVPSIRLELMRDGLEDYEYLYVLNGGQPLVGQASAADAQVDKIVGGLTATTHSGEFMYNLRRVIGLKNGGEIASIPDIEPRPTHPRAEGAPGNYYINFQDPAGEPANNPLVVNGKTYMKIGGSDYSETAGYGWYAPPDVHWQTAFLGGGPNVLQSSILYSDYGRIATFEFDLPNGDYNVTVSVGWSGTTYSHQKVDIEGVSFIDDEATTPSTPYLVRTRPVSIHDSKLTMAMGIRDEYTMLNYLNIEAAATTSTLISSSANPSISGQPVTFTASVTSSTPGTITGSVTFRDGTSTLGSSSVSGGQASCSTSSLSVNTHSITASYEGDARYFPSTSPALLQVVNQGTFTAPIGLTATGSSASTIAISWVPVYAAASYEVFRASVYNGTYTLVGSPQTTSMTDGSLAANTAYVYKVRAVDRSGNRSGDSSIEVGSTFVFMDDPLVAGSTVIKATHLIQLRAAVNAVRAAAGLMPYSFDDSSPSGMRIRATHVQQVRTALQAAVSAASFPAATFTDPGLAAGTVIKAAHIQEIRNAVK